MIVDKSHSKKDIINLFRRHGIVINNNLTKGQIVSNIDSYIDNFIYNEKIKNLTELKEYLKNPSIKQKPTQLEKINFMFKAKRIIKWYNNDFILHDGLYNSMEDPYNDVMSIYMWGDFPTVRRACRMYNASPFCKNHVNPVISDQVEEELYNNRIIKKQFIYSLKVKHDKENPFIVTFD